MPRVNLPPGCMGFADGDTKYKAVNGAGSYVNIDDTDPQGKRALQKLRNQDYAQAGLVDAGPEKFALTDIKKKTGRWCKPCNRLWNQWNQVCGKCGTETVPEDELDTTAYRDPDAPYSPFYGSQVPH